LALVALASASLTALSVDTLAADTSLALFSSLFKSLGGGLKFGF
jgi:hypothetical protein